jgi:hypothetical protein
VDPLQIIFLVNRSVLPPNDDEKDYNTSRKSPNNIICGTTVMLNLLVCDRTTTGVMQVTFRQGGCSRNYKILKQTPELALVRSTKTLDLL